MQIIKFYCLFILFACSAAAFAATSSGTARVTILESLSIEETSVVQFGSIPGDNGQCSMDAAGNLIASYGAKCQGSGQLGRFNISGSPGQSINIAVNSASAGSGVSFQPQLVSDMAPTLTEGDTIALIAGQLHLNNAEAGVQSITYYITVNYN